MPKSDNRMFHTIRDPTYASALNVKSLQLKIYPILHKIAHSTNLCSLSFCFTFCSNSKLSLSLSLSSHCLRFCSC